MPMVGLGWISGGHLAISVCKFGCIHFRGSEKPEVFLTGFLLAGRAALGDVGWLISAVPIRGEIERRRRRPAGECFLLCSIDELPHRFSCFLAGIFLWFVQNSVFLVGLGLLSAAFGNFGMQIWMHKCFCTCGW
jgi:hypothetical protein